MNNHQNAIFYQFENFLKTPLALLGVDLKNSNIKSNVPTNYQYKRHSQQGYSLYELGFVVLLMALITATSSHIFSSATENVKISQAIRDLEVNFPSAIKACLKRNSAPNDTICSKDIMTKLSPLTNETPWGESWTSAISGASGVFTFTITYPFAKAEEGHGIIRNLTVKFNRVNGVCAKGFPTPAPLAATNFKTIKMEYKVGAILTPLDC